MVPLTVAPNGLPVSSLEQPALMHSPTHNNNGESRVQRMLKTTLQRGEAGRVGGEEKESSYQEILDGIEVLLHGNPYSEA